MQLETSQISVFTKMLGTIGEPLLRAGLAPKNHIEEEVTAEILINIVAINQNTSEQ
jgi:hypothetical protein